MDNNTVDQETVKDIIKGVIAIVVIIVCAFLVYNGKSDINSLIVIITGIINYFLGLTTKKPTNGE